ncbi:MAG: hypothetical protein HYV39_01150 [Candidatus Levybacteria bacterium]|nr:hypothetical protein [Candidatus Levybacteria bacterium]
MKLNTLILLIATFILFMIGVQVSPAVFGATPTQYGFTFPIDELGNCATVAECGDYCEKDGNLPSCMAFVKKYQITKDDVLTFTIDELGNCQMGTDCRNFCNRDENITKCIDFADKYDLLATSNLELAQKFNKAVGSGGGPGGCRSLEQCERYCDDSNHTNECLDYVGKKELLPTDELNKVRKVAEGFRQGVETPGKCRDYTECNVYCTDPGHYGECGEYAVRVGYFSAEEAEAAKKYGGVGPGGCKSKGECEEYCNNSSNQNTCLQFAKEHGIQVSFNGPGGCSDIDSCTKYCTEHKDDATCKQYAGASSGFSGPGGCSDEASCKDYCMKNQSDAECQKMMGQYREGFKGPGGCSDIESCKSYCMSNKDDPECAKYAGQYGGGSPDQGQQQNQQQPQDQ